MGRVKKPHHQGTHQVRARRVRNWADADPTTRCWRCRNLLPDCKPHRDGTPARWTAGHLTDGEVNGRLAPECSTCNFSEGAIAGNATRKAEPHTERW